MYGLNSLCFRRAPVINLSCMLTLRKTLCMHTLSDLLHRCNFDKVFQNSGHFTQSDCSIYSCDIMSHGITGPSDWIGLRGDTNGPPLPPSGEGGTPLKHF